MTAAVYLAGKITGDPNFMEKFACAQAVLEEKGFIVFNPALLPQGVLTWDGYMNIGIAMLRECPIVCMLPDWRESDGAKREMGEAVALCKSVIYYENITDTNAAAEEENHA